jgi:trk system potassium uptake protein TrkH
MSFNSLLAPVLNSLWDRPARLISASFLAVITLGAAALMLPFATVDGAGATAVDAFFTSVSAVCVTGLSVLNTAPGPGANPELTSFSLFGQVVILVLVQLGGLGIMTLSMAVLTLGGKHLGFGTQNAMSLVLDETDAVMLRRSTVFILLLTVFFEGLGTVLLFQGFSAHGFPTGEALWLALFHSVAAFCNAGFSNFGDNLMGFRGDGLILGTVSGLIVAGGLGFTALAVIGAWLLRLLSYRGQQRIVRGYMSTTVAPPGKTASWFIRMGRTWNLHTRLALLSTAVLLVGGTLWFFLAEYYGAFNSLSLGDKLLNAWFQSVTTRTAGFNSVDQAALGRASLAVTMVLMFIGGSPGGTAGGVKTTTIATIWMGFQTVLSGAPRMVAANRSVEPSTVIRAAAVVLLSSGLLLAGFLALLITQPHLGFVELLFESISAFGTVGLSMGITAKLGALGKVVLMFLMFCGRVGPLTIAIAFSRPPSGRTAGLRYPEGRIMVG